MRVFVLWLDVRGLDGSNALMFLETVCRVPGWELGEAILLESCFQDINRQNFLPSFIDLLTSLQAAVYICTVVVWTSDSLARRIEGWSAPRKISSPAFVPPICCTYAHNLYRHSPSVNPICTDVNTLEVRRP